MRRGGGSVREGQRPAEEAGLLQDVRVQREAERRREEGEGREMGRERDRDRETER